MRSSCAAPVRGVFLPIDTPPRPDILPPVAQRGLVWDLDQGEGVHPIARPWPLYGQSEHFPWVRGSNCGPAARGTLIMFSLNNYSPGIGRAARTLATQIIPAKAIYRGRTAGVVPRKQARRKVFPFPATNPTWPNVFGGRVDS